MYLVSKYSTFNPRNVKFVIMLLFTFIIITNKKYKLEK